MRDITVRYESKWDSMLTQPFEVGLRHLEVAFSEDSHEALIGLAKERVIYRPYSRDNTYKTLSLQDRAVHLTAGLLETVGYIVPFIPFVAFAVDRLNKPWFPKGCYEFRTNMQEGGTSEEYDAACREGLDTSTQLRRTPFDANATLDPFYKGASWAKAPAKTVQLPSFIQASLNYWEDRISYWENIVAQRTSKEV